MRSRVHRSGQQLLDALGENTSGYYATFGRSRIEPHLLQRIEATAGKHRHRNLSAIAELRPGTTRLIHQFFEYAARSDPNWRYAFSSGVLLAIPEYPDLTLIFLLRELEKTDSNARVELWIDDDSLAQLVEYELNGGVPPVFHATQSRALVRGARSLLRHALASALPDKSEIVLFTLGDNVARNAPDAYFGELASVLAARRRVLTVFAAAGGQLRFPTTPHAVPFEAFMELRDAMQAWSRDANDESMEPDAADKNAVILTYLRQRERASGELFMQDLMARAFDRMFARLRPTTVVYPFENRSWEKHLVRAARRNAVSSIGYQHSSITPRHLAFTPAGQTASEDLPDRILTCGEITAKAVARGLPQSVASITVSAALRARRLSIPAPSAGGLLVPISSSRAEAWEILSMVNAAAPMLEMPVIVRTHPTIPVDDLYKQFRWPGNVTLSQGRTLEQDLGDAALVAYSSSTVALEGMLYGRLPIYLEIGDVPSGNPIDGEFDFVFNAASGAELAQVVKQIHGTPEAAIKSLRERARNFAERYLIEPTLQNVGRMAELIAQ